MAISAFLKNKGLDKLAKHFDDQISEEHEHAKLIYDYLTDMNAQVDMLEVDKVDLKFNVISDIASAYLDREKLTTEDLIEEKDISIDDKDGVSEEFLRQMIDKQRAELEEANTFMDNVELCSDDWKFVKIWNDSIGD